MASHAAHKSSLHFTCLVLLSFFLVVSASHAFASPNKSKNPEGLVSFDKGYKKNNVRAFQPADPCTHTPCVIGKFGAIYLSETARRDYTIELGLFHEGDLRSVALFEEGSNIDEKFTERFFNTKQNKKIFDLENAIQNSITDTLYIYGLGIHYTLDEGDVVIIKLTDKKNEVIKTSYYFRYHRKGPIWDGDVAIISPLNVNIPNPNNTIRNSMISLSLTTSVGWYMDPEKKYSFGRKFLHAWKLNMSAGLIRRYEYRYEGGTDKYTDSKVDGFFGLGFTFVDFFVGGMGVNMVRDPHSFFPFVGIEVKHMYQFIKSLKTSSKKKWQKYLKAQQGVSPAPDHIQR
ncbi:MAG: hypothetical protein HQM16_03790 [Deltaproteobacteria bacterium]|nr:hypothetical protein [Deltaproteobacteria bacterium]